MPCSMGQRRHLVPPGYSLSELATLCCFSYGWRRYNAVLHRLKPQVIPRAFLEWCVRIDSLLYISNGWRRYSYCLAPLITGSLLLKSQVFGVWIYRSQWLFSCVVLRRYLPRECVVPLLWARKVLCVAANAREIILLFILSLPQRFTLFLPFPEYSTLGEA